MASRTLDTEWNIYSRQEWIDGWEQMKIPGTYERGIFGDLMLPGIACGIRKFILIFNTNPDSPHDPIYVVDPRQFNVQADTVVPIILGYNMSHYESFHPQSNKDILASIDLVKEYLENRYRYGKKDFPFLLKLDDERPMQIQEASHPNGSANLEVSESNSDNLAEIMAPSPKKIFKSSQADQSQSNSKYRARIAVNPQDDDFKKTAKSTYSKPNKAKCDMQEENTILGNLNTDEDINLEEIDDFLDEKSRIKNRKMQPHKEEFSMENLCYKLKNKAKEYPIGEVNGMMKCPFCPALVKNVKLHFTRNIKCGENIDEIRPHPQRRRRSRRQ